MVRVLVRIRLRRYNNPSQLKITCRFYFGENLSRDIGSPRYIVSHLPFELDI